MEQRLNAINKQTNTVNTVGKTQIRKHRLKDTTKEETETSTSNHSQAAISGSHYKTTIDRADNTFTTKQSPYFTEMDRGE